MYCNPNFKIVMVVVTVSKMKWMEKYREHGRNLVKLSNGNLNMSITLPDNYQECERGNIWLTDGENHVAWFEIEGTGCRLEVSVTPGNYPGFYVTLLSKEQSTNEHIAKHIQTRCCGWEIKKLNIFSGVKIGPPGTIYKEQV